MDIPVADEGPEFDPAVLDEAAEDAATSEAPEWIDNRDLPDRKSLNLDGILYGALQRSHQDLDSWLQKMRPHRNNGHIEVFGGMPYGDTVRSYDVRVALDAASLEQIGLSERDIYTEGVGYEFGAAIGFTPSPWMDLSALFSLMGGTKELTTGWATIDGNIVQDSDVFKHNSTRSLSAIVEPRMRLYLLPVSWMKIYGLGGITVRFADAYTVPDLNVVDYPDRPSWTMVGWMVGGGLMFDPHERLGIYVETPWVHWFQPGDSYSIESGVLPPILPGSVEKTGWVLRGTAGVQFRL
jgi:opacity protein-like surface antigen